MDFFKTLGGGARFDKMRFKEDFDIFEENASSTASNQKQTPSANNSTVTQETDNMLKELDFFAARTTTKEKDEEKNDKSKKNDPESMKEERRKRRKAEGKGKESVAVATPNLDTFADAEQINVFRRANKINVYGTDVPNPVQSFEHLLAHYDLPDYVGRNLKAFGFSEPTPIQKQAVPIMLGQREIIACAPTGSGKTLAFVLPIISALDAHRKGGYRAVIVSPTRELAQQIFNECQRLAARPGKNVALKICMLTKATAATQAQSSQTPHNYDVLITTPMRLVHAIEKENVNLSSVQHLILDEADRLLDLGFLEQVDEIFAACTNPKLQRSLFSATMPSGVEALAKTVMQNPIRIIIGAVNAATTTIDQKLTYVGQEEGKLIAIRQLVQNGLKPPVLIFVQSIDRAKELFHELVYDGINVDVIHSERTKSQRDAIVEQFRLGKVWVLISTELMARGMDFKGVNLVINYDFPQSIQSYIHRIGRTGRAGKAGEAVTYFTKEDAPFLKSIVNVMRESGCDVPEWMLSLKRPSKTDKRNLRQRAPKRTTVNTTSDWDRKKSVHKRDMITNSKKRKSGTEAS